MAREECRVTERGVWHVFAPLEVGAACVCGRKIAVVQDETLTLQDEAFMGCRPRWKHYNGDCDRPPGEVDRHPRCTFQP